MDDDYCLRKFVAAAAEMRTERNATTGCRRSSGGERGRLPAGQEAREELLFQLLAQLESVESLAQAMASLQGRAFAQAPLETVLTADGGVVGLSASFQRRTCALCRDRAEQAAAGAGATQKEGASTAWSNGKSTSAEKKAAISALRFRAAAHELYALLESVELQPAGAAGEDEDGDPAFLPPGKRGWKHAVLCEEAAGWADMASEAGGTRGEPLPSAELPDFQVQPRLWDMRCVVTPRTPLADVDC